MDNPWLTLAGMLARTPELDGSLCAGDTSGLLDATDSVDSATAARICHQCPAIVQCRTWATSLPPNSLNGTVGGQLHVWVQHESLRRQRKSIPVEVLT